MSYLIRCSLVETECGCALKCLLSAAKPVPQVQAELKLYQPAQNRFYMVAAQLVCPRPGLPDRTITSAKEERPRFVLRQLVQKVPSEGEFDPEGKDANGLDEVDERRTLTGHDPLGRRHETLRHGVGQAKRVAEGHHHLADRELARATEGQRLRGGRALHA